jgi:hypothetical protein
MLHATQAVAKNQQPLLVEQNKKLSEIIGPHTEE